MAVDNQFLFRSVADQIFQNKNILPEDVQSFPQSNQLPGPLSPYHVAEAP